MERAECAHHPAFPRCHAAGIRLALDEVRYLDTTPLAGSAQIGSYVSSEGEEAMTLALWIVQILLALIFALSGFGKVALPVEQLRERWNWTKHVDPPVIRLIGSLEILGALGLIVPRATGYLPWLTPVAAVGLVLTMMGAILTHLRLQEARVVGVPVVLLLLSLFIALGYFVFVPVG
jgi:uncharacterized membrane protein YphA (DoxX/SURF4 family)